jgi:hypothetical protein
LEDDRFLKPPIVDADDYFAEIYNMPVLCYHGLYLGFPTLFNPLGAIPPPITNFTRINQVELAVSHDASSWERACDREVLLGIEPYDGVAYDTSQVLLSGPPVVRPDGELWFYYVANRFNMNSEDFKEHGATEELFRLGVKPSDFQSREALCLAKMRPDGFVSLDAAMQGTLVTKSFIWPAGKDLYVNIDAEWGEVYVEVVDFETAVAPLQGFGGRAMQPITGDHPHGLKYDWEGKSCKAGGWEVPVRLKFYCRQARLYSWWLS